MTTTARWIPLAAIFVFACVAAYAAVPASSSTEVTTIETLYADLNDSSGVVATIDSGLFKTYQGKDRAAWQSLYLARRREVAARLAKLQKQSLNPRDARAVAVMTKALESMPEGAPTSLESSGHCKDAQQSNLDY